MCLTIKQQVLQELVSKFNLSVEPDYNFDNEQVNLEILEKFVDLKYKNSSDEIVFYANAFFTTFITGIGITIGSLIKVPVESVVKWLMNREIILSSTSSVIATGTSVGILVGASLAYCMSIYFNREQNKNLFKREVEKVKEEQRHKIIY